MYMFSGLMPLTREELEWKNPLEDLSTTQRLVLWKDRLHKGVWNHRSNNPHIDQAFLRPEPSHHPPPAQPFW
jgi:hypothetical protein